MRESDEPQRDESDQSRDDDGRRDRPLRARRRRQARRAPFRRAPRPRGSACGASPALLGEIADQRRHGQSCARPSGTIEKANAVKRPNATPSAITPGSIDGAIGIGSSDAEQPIDGKRDRRAKRRAGERANQRDDRELDERERDDARSGRADRLQNRKRCALAFDEPLRRVGDADPADDQRQQSGERKVLGEPIEIATEVRGNAEARAGVPSGLGKARLASSRRAWTAASSGAPPAPPMMTRVVQRTKDPGCTSPVR